MLGTSKINEKKRKAENELILLAPKAARVPVVPPSPCLHSSSLPTPKVIHSSSSTWLQAPFSTDRDEEERAIEALEASSILRSFSSGTRGTKLERKPSSGDRGSIPGPLSLHLPFPNPKWRMPFDSPDSSLPNFLIPSPRSSSTSRSDSCDISIISPVPCKALSVLLSNEVNGLISNTHARSMPLKSKQNRVDMIHFIFKVTLKLDYLPETAFIAVSFFDRYIAKNNVRVLKQQRLLALTCIFIAGKIHEELSEPLISEILEFNDSLFSANCLKKMERKVFDFFDWNVACVTPLAILDEAFHSIGYPEARNCFPTSPYNTSRSKIESLLNPLLQKVLLDIELCCVRPSLILRTCLEFLELQRSVGRMGVDILQIAMLLPSVDETVRSKIFNCLQEPVIPHSADEFLIGYVRKVDIEIAKRRYTS